MRSMTQSRLGRIGAAEYLIANTRQPWTADIDAIVVPCDLGLGDLGRAVQSAYPTAAWSSIDFSQITPQEPLVTGLPPHPRGWKLSSAILVTSQPSPDDDPDLDSIRTATAASIKAARQLGARSLGMPLLAIGVMTLPQGAVAAAVVDTVVRAVEDSPINRIVFLCVNDETEQAIRTAWQDVLVPPKNFPEESSEDTGEFAKKTDTTAERPSAELAGGVSTDLVDPRQGIPLDRDQLGVAPYVSMLATVIADRTTSLPLSVGVFGEWGSGKSFFMGLLRQRVEDLSQSGNPAYCASIEQIGFNAWHYADSNLWASLGDEIFRELASDGSTIEQQRERLRDELAGQLSYRRTLEDATAQARAETAALRSQIDQAIASRARSVRSLLGALRNSPRFHQRIESLWRRLGFTNEFEQGRILAEQMRGTLDDAAALRRSPRNRQGRILLGVSALALVVAAFIAILVPAARELVAWIGGVVSAASVGTGIVAFGAARSGLSMLRELSEDLASGTHLPAEIDELRRAEATQQVAEAQLDEVVSRVGELNRQLGELSPGRRLYSFLAERAHGESYTSNLGLISMIRKDFEQLIALLEDWRRNPTADDGTTRHPVERIVLYIDDLDRCSTRQVVDVLQAVHLLLALDLFVVVVGVDPRWLVRSLSHHYDATLREGHGSTWHATPEDYLEKILNIPIVLPGMGTGSLSNLVRSMIDTDLPPTGPPPPANALPPAATPLPQQGFPVEAGSELHVQFAGTASVARQQPPRPLTANEVDLLAALDPMIGTPRDAKRLINLYRMLRSTRDLSEASRFLGEDGQPGEYEAVIVLLGLLTAHPRRLDELLHTPPDPSTDRAGGLMHRPTDLPVAQFVDELRPRRAGDSWRSPALGHLTDDEARDWTRIHAGLASLDGHLTSTDVAPFQLWTPRIRRFSYILSPAGPSAQT
jgi:KAP-like P-loop domain-containing protein